MRTVRILSVITVDDDGNVVRCISGTEPGHAPMFSVSHDGLGAMDRCTTAVRHHLKMETYRQEFDDAITRPAVHVAVEPAA